MGITYETPEQKQEIMDSIRKDIATKHKIEDTANNPLLDELVKTEFSRRETQASFTKARQELKATEAEKTFLMEQAQKSLNLSSVQTEELENLKLDDPDKYIETVSKLKTQAKEDFDKTISEGLGHARSEASKAYELSRREEILKEFSEANPGFNLTDEKVREQLPPKLVNQLATGEITFEDFLTKAQKFDVAQKVVKVELPDSGSKVLDKVNGTNAPTKDAIDKSMQTEGYGNVIL